MSFKDGAEMVATDVDGDGGSILPCIAPACTGAQVILMAAARSSEIRFYLSCFGSWFDRRSEQAPPLLARIGRLLRPIADLGLRILVPNLMKTSLDAKLSISGLRSSKKFFIGLRVIAVSATCTIKRLKDVYLKHVKNPSKSMASFSDCR